MDAKTKNYWTDVAIYRRMRNGWRGGGIETPCGSGSTNVATFKIRKWLPEIFARYAIKSVCDAGAGDMRWHGQTFKDVEYKPFDLVPRTFHVKRLDVTRAALPTCDAILCRHVLIHLDPPRILEALRLFKHSAKYLIASQYPRAPCFRPNQDYNPTDLRPWLDHPLEQIEDTLIPDTYLALWQLNGG